MKEKKLHSIAPILSSIKKNKNNFKTPKGYFNSFDDNILSETKLNSIKKTEASIFKTPINYFNTIEDVVITKLKAETIQQKEQDIIPKDYFDSIEDTIIAKINTLNKTKKSKNTLLKYSIPIAIAASFLLIFNIFDKTDTLTFDSIETAEIDTWITNNLNEITPSQMATIYSDIELDYESFSSQLTDEEVLDYLQKEDLENILIED